MHRPAVVEHHGITLLNCVFAHALPLKRAAHIIHRYLISRTKRIYAFVGRDIDQNSTGDERLRMLDPQGFDAWEVLPGQGAYYNPVLKSAAGERQIEGYCTDIVTDLAIEWPLQRLPPWR